MPFTWMVTVSITVTPPSVPVVAYLPEATALVGVPEIEQSPFTVKPVAVVNAAPLQPVIDPPTAPVVVLLVIATLRPYCADAVVCENPFTVMLTVSVAVPTVMPYLVVALAAVGVPVISPVDVFSERPEGSEGFTEYVPLPTTPVGLLVAIATYLPALIDELAYANPFTVMSRVSVVEAMPFTVAVMVYFVKALATVGVPVITHVVVLSARPVGSVGRIEHAVGAPPTWFGVVVPALTLRLKVSGWLA